MGNTNDRWTQETPNPDLELFMGVTDFLDTTGTATLASAGEGLLTRNLATTVAGTFFANITAYLRRTGVLMTPNLAQMQFGTAALQPGPSSVAGTSDPSALPAGMPPFAGSSVGTLALPRAGAIPKGIQINSMDVIYLSSTVNLALAQIGLTKTVFANGAAPVVTNLLALGTNGLLVAFAAHEYRINVPIVTPAFVTDSGAEILLHVNLTAGAGGTAKFYGVNLKCSYNLN
jgi:hypothetical protein